MPLHLRSFPAELAGVVSGWARTDEEVLMWCGAGAAPVPTEQVSAWAREDGVQPFGLYRGQRLVAYGELWVDDEEAEVELARLIVDPGERGQGLGRYLAAGLARAARFRIRGCSCGSIPATSPPFAVMPRRASSPSSPIRRPSGTPDSRSAISGSARPRNAGTRLNRPSMANALNDASWSRPHRRERPDRRIFARVGPMARQVVGVQITPLWRLLGSGLGPRLYVEPAGRVTQIRPGTTGMRASSAQTWSGRCGGTMACAASSSCSTRPRWRCSRCSATSWSGPCPATLPRP